MVQIVFNYYFKINGLHMVFRLISTLVLSVVAISTTWAAPVVHTVDAVIIGGGVGGGAAAIYLGRAGFHPLVIEKSTAGGAIAQSDLVENWPGAIKIRGMDLMENIRKQAEQNGAVFINGEAISVDFSKRPYTIVMRSFDKDVVQTIHTKTCIIATGSTPNRLNVPGESEYWGRGVSACAICDGALYRGKKVGVVGGGDAAILEALYLANIASDVTLLVRKDQFKGVDIKKKEALLSLPNVTVRYQTQVKKIQGDGQGLTSIFVASDQDPSATFKLDLDGLFLAIGSHPNTALFKGQLDLDERGYIVLKKGQETSVAGVYAIGDVVDPIYKQAISAAGDGAKAALSVIHTDLSQASTQTVMNRPMPKQNNPQVVEITTMAQFEEEIRSSTMPLIIDFYASWCSPCKRIAPKLESTAAQLSGKVKFLKVNVDKMGDLTQNYKIRSMPTVIYMDQSGAVLDRKVGEGEISDLLAQLMK